MNYKYEAFDQNHNCLNYKLPQKKKTMWTCLQIMRHAFVFFSFIFQEMLNCWYCPSTARVYRLCSLYKNSLGTPRFFIYGFSIWHHFNIFQDIEFLSISLLKMWFHKILYFYLFISFDFSFFLYLFCSSCPKITISHH